MTRFPSGSPGAGVRANVVSKAGFPLLCVLLALLAAGPVWSDPVVPGVGGAVQGPFAPFPACGDGGGKPLSVSALLAFPTLFGLGQPALLSAELDEGETVHFEKSVRWMKYSMIALGVNTGALVLSFIAPTAGGIVGIMSLGAWSITTYYMAFGYRDLTAALDEAGSDAPRPTVAGYASLGAAAFAVGAVTAIGLSFSDTTGAATVLAYICTAVSGVSGIVGIVKTYRYAEEVGYTIEKGL